MSNFGKEILRSELQLIVDLLNEIVAKQPDVMTLLNDGVLASEEIQAMETVRCRVCNDDREWLTVTGIISAIGRVIGADAGLEIRSKWEGEGDDYHLVGFCVGEGVMPLID
jgi:hypothetical protein